MCNYPNPWYIWIIILRLLSFSNIKLQIVCNDMFLSQIFVCIPFVIFYMLFAFRFIVLLCISLGDIFAKELMLILYRWLRKILKSPTKNYLCDDHFIILQIDTFEGMCWSFHHSITDNDRIHHKLLSGQNSFNTDN